MDDAESREDIPRISIDTLRDWHRTKANFSKAVLEQFDQTIRQSGLESERASLLPHVQQVRQSVVPSQSVPPHTSSQFIETTFEKAKLNVRINGKKFEDLKDEDDGTLSQRIRVCSRFFLIVAFEFRQGSRTVRRGSRPRDVVPI